MPKNHPQLGGGMDPSGSVYEKEGSIFRSINPSFIPFFQDLLENKKIQGMLGHELVNSVILSGENSRDNLILKHQKISPANFPYEWPNSMLQDAARLTLDICTKLLDEGFILKDATPWNVVFDSGRPVFVDFASIMPVDKDLVWVALDQFSRLFLFPLLAAEHGFGRVCRSLMLASQQGISSIEADSFLPGFAWLKKPWLLNRLYIPRTVVSLLQKSGQDKEIGKYVNKVEVPPEKRKKFFLGLLSDLNSIKFQVGKSRWSQYYLDMGSFFDPQRFNQKQEVVSKLLKDLQPGTVTDIGCNMGGYAILAAKQGASVTAFDTDEDSVEMLYQLVKTKGLKILPLIMDVTNPSPAAGWRSMQYPSAVERFRAEGAMALAIVHHLAITQGQSFSRIVDELSDYCEKWLLTEFVPPEDPRAKEILLTCRRDMSWYTLEGFLATLKTKFKEVTTFDSHPSGRVLILCKNKY